MRQVLSACCSLYRYLLSPFLHSLLLLPGGCRFVPTCSAYGADAIRQYGLAVGFVFLLKRLARCHPWGGSGYDPVPIACSSLPRRRR